MPVRRLQLIAFSLTGLRRGAGRADAMRAVVASANPTQGGADAQRHRRGVPGHDDERARRTARPRERCIGVLILGVLDNGLSQMSVNSYVQQMLTGGIIILAVALSSLSRRSA